MPDTSTKHAFGEKANLENAITQGKVNEFDEVFLTDTDELAYVNKQKEVKYVTPRTQNVVEFNGVTEIGGLKASDFPSGIPAGKSVEDILKMLIQKRIPAKYDKPTITLGNSRTTAGTKEAGTTISPVLNATFTQKDAGALTEIKIQKNNADIEGATSATSPYSYEPDDFVLGDETVTFKAVASYAAGEIKNDNMGTPDPSGQIKAGSITSSAISYTGSRYTFYGCGTGALPELNSDTIRALSGKSLGKTSGTFNMKVNAGNQYIIIAVPAPYKATSINYTPYDPNYKTMFTDTTVQVADSRGGENGLKDYNVSYYAMSAPAGADMDLIVTLGR